MRPNDLWIYPDTEPQGLCLNGSASTALVVGPFEEEEEGIGVASDVVKVQGEDPAIPGSLRVDRVLIGPPLRKPRYRNDSLILV